MLSTFVISFREFLEAFLIIGVFLGISKRLGLKREKEILLASILGIAISLLMPITVFILGEKASLVFSEKNAELLEGYLMIFSGLFIVYVVFSLHSFFVLKRSKAVLAAHEKLKNNVFDLSLFLTITFFIIREGFEIALFTGTTSLFSKFAENIAGLLLGFTSSAVLGLLTFFAYIKLSIGKIFKYTEYLIIALGAAFVKNGAGELAEVYFDVHLDNIIPISLPILPSSQSFIGHLINTMTGLTRQIGLIEVAILAGYTTAVYLLVIKKRSPSA